MNTTELVEKLRDLYGRLQCINKEIMSANVNGLGLVREDLGIRRAKRTVHGQTHSIPLSRTKGSLTTGQGKYPESNIALDSDLSGAYRS